MQNHLGKAKAYKSHVGSQNVGRIDEDEEFRDYRAYKAFHMGVKLGAC